MKSLTSFIVPVLALALDVIGQETIERGNCTTFIPDDEPGYLISLDPMRVSGGVTCPSNTNRTCPLSARGDTSVFARNNASLVTVVYAAAPQYDPFIDSIQSALGNRTLPFAPSFNNSILGPIDTTYILQPGQSAYLNFTAFLFCFTGRTDDCNSSRAVADDTPVEVCAPAWSSGWRGQPLLSGEYTLVNVSESEAGNLTDPYERYAGPSRDVNAARMGSLSFWMMTLVFGVAAFLL